MAVNSLLVSLNLAWLRISPLVVNLILALLLLLLGLLLASGLGKLVTTVLKAIQLDKAAKQVGFDRILEKGSVGKSAAVLLGDLIYWLTAIVVVVGVLRVFGLPVEGALAKVFTYMGVVFLAAFILGIGLFLAGLISGIVRIVLGNLELEGAKTVSRVVYYMVIVFSFMAALAELGINLDSLAPHLGIVLGMPALAAAIAFGLGCKDMAADFLHNLFKGK
ncbi:hypothetical protein ACFL5U_01650 [Candidatus Margulisiibacteriota bacterium]